MHKQQLKIEDVYLLTAEKEWITMIICIPTPDQNDISHQYNPKITKN